LRYVKGLPGEALISLPRKYWPRPFL